MTAASLLRTKHVWQNQSVSAIEAALSTIDGLGATIEDGGAPMAESEGRATGFGDVGTMAEDTISCTAGVPDAPDGSPHDVAASDSLDEEATVVGSTDTSETPNPTLGSAAGVVCSFTTGGEHPGRGVSQDTQTVADALLCNMHNSQSHPRVGATSRATAGAGIVTGASVDTAAAGNDEEGALASPQVVAVEAVVSAPQVEDALDSPHDVVAPASPHDATPPESPQEDATVGGSAEASETPNPKLDSAGEAEDSSTIGGVYPRRGVSHDTQMTADSLL
jgi:hypothetical protein